jgi:hypothetical protein
VRRAKAAAPTALRGGLQARLGRADPFCARSVGINSRALQPWARDGIPNEKNASPG